MVVYCFFFNGLLNTVRTVTFNMTYKSDCTQLTLILSFRRVTKYLAKTIYFLENFLKESSRGVYKPNKR